MRGSGSARVKGGTLQNIVIEGRLAVANGDNLNLRGTITNNGLLQVASNGADTSSLILQGDTTLTGSGETVLGGTPIGGSIFSLAPGGGNTRLTLLDHTLRGSGSISSLKMTNQGRIVAEGAGGLDLALTDAPDSLLNTGGVIEIADGSALGVLTGTVSGGIIRGFQTSTLSGGTLRDLTLEGNLIVPDENQLIVSGMIINNGTLTLDDQGRTSHLLVNGEATLAGSGKTLMPSTQTSIFGSAIVPVALAPGSGLIIAAGHTLQGGGLVAMGRFVNEGSVIVDTKIGMHFDGFAADEVLVNRGRLRIENDSEMSVQLGSGAPNYLDGDPYTMRQDAAGASTEVFGKLTVKELELQAGVLRGTGEIVGDVINSGGTIIVGASPGKLSIDGDLVLGTGSELQLEINGDQPGVSHDWLAVTGDIALGGLLRIAFGYTPAAGTNFLLLSSETGFISGAFDTVVATGADVVVRYGAQGVSVTAVPVPGSILLLASGLLGLLPRLRADLGSLNAGSP